MELTWFFNNSKDDQMQREIFTLQLADWNETLANEQSVNLTFNRPNWYNFFLKMYCQKPLLVVYYCKKQKFLISSS